MYQTCKCNFEYNNVEISFFFKLQLNVNSVTTILNVDSNLNAKNIIRIEFDLI